MVKYWIKHKKCCTQKHSTRLNVSYFTCVWEWKSKQTRSSNLGKYHFAVIKVIQWLEKWILFKLQQLPDIVLPRRWHSRFCFRWTRPCWRRNRSQVSRETRLFYVTRPTDNLNQLTWLYFYGLFRITKQNETSWYAYW